MSNDNPNAENHKHTITAPAGYRQLNDAELAAMELKQDLGFSIKLALEHISSPEVAAELDPRWLAIARTHFQEGLMALGRAITKPTFF